jgi:RNA polymerase sigma factor (TIGR02999 family)
MGSPSVTDVTQLLLAWGEGDEDALDRLVPLVLGELRRLASSYIRRERMGFLQTTDLVNEAYIRLVDSKNVHCQNRSHFFAVAARLMRRILVDQARSRNSQKRGGKEHRIDIEDVVIPDEDRAADFVALDDALRTLAAFDPRKSQVVELRFFGGLSEEEIAEVLKTSARTVRREWNLARAWLRREVSRDSTD